MWIIVVKRFIDPWYDRWFPKLGRRRVTIPVLTYIYLTLAFPSSWVAYLSLILREGASYNYLFFFYSRYIVGNHSAIYKTIEAANGNYKNWRLKCCASAKVCRRRCILPTLQFHLFVFMQFNELRINMKVRVDMLHESPSAFYISRSYAFKAYVNAVTAVRLIIVLIKSTAAREQFLLVKI